MRGLALALVLAAGSAFAQFAPQSAGTEPLPPAQEARVLKLGKELRCAVCQGLSITDSPASMARSQLDMVRTLVEQGKSDEEIRRFFVARYGEWVLLDPTTHGVTFFVWAGPILLILGGLAFIGWYSMSHKAPANAPAEAPASPAAPEPSPQSPAPEGGEDDPYLRAVRAELEK